MLSKPAIEKQIGRELTESELCTIEWLDGWEKQTSINIMGLIQAAREHGRAEGATA